MATKMKTRRTKNRGKVFGKVAKAALRGVPGLGMAMGVADVAGSLRGGGGRGAAAPRRKAKSMQLRGGKLFIGFTAKEVKRALRAKPRTKIVTTTGRKVA